jgi:hypothetical protein
MNLQLDWHYADWIGYEIQPPCFRGHEDPYFVFLNFKKLFTVSFTRGPVFQNIILKSIHVQFWSLFYQQKSKDM